MLEEPSIMAKRPIPAAPHLLPIVPKFASVAGSCCFISIRVVNSKQLKDKCNCRSFIQKIRLEDQEFNSSWSSLDRYFCSCGHHAQYHPPGNRSANTNSDCRNDCGVTDCDMEQQTKEEEEEIPMQVPRALSPVPPHEAENNRHIWHLYQKTAKLEQEILHKPNPEDVKSSVGEIVGSLDERLIELEERLEETEVRLEESERKARTLQEEVNELINENEDLQRNSSPAETVGTEDLERLYREESERRQDAEKSLQEALTALKPISKENPWRVYVKLVLDPDQKTPASQDSAEHTRGCHQHVLVEGYGAPCFRRALSLSFPSSLLAKQWIPLMAMRNSEGKVELERPFDLENFPNLWSSDFLRNTCAITVDGIDELYIAPQTGPLTLDELESPRESPGLTEASTISSTSAPRRSIRNKKRSITGNDKIDTPLLMKRVRVKS
ncbi:hypothetical protein H072_10415 [Dactylellina haptotyla CBS 200.50]|uniref:Uncharacterized protein n=1 Tax=Dactylellina haptotyla (strain CBS 200.50) TaxID=1284197 RepID=S8A041_DACHA|nr:hypothetical protein H072_10415 [Dactylellina haptotyla CBS 200.50]